MNRSKQSIALDLDDAKDLDLAQELCRRADVVVENFRSGALDRRGLGYDQVRRDNPDVVYCSVTAFGDGAGASLSG